MFFDPVQSAYDREVLGPVYTLPRVDVGTLVSGGVREEGPVQLRYSTKKEFEALAKKLKLMSDFRVSVTIVTIKQIKLISKNIKIIFVILKFIYFLAN